MPMHFIITGLVEKRRSLWVSGKRIGLMGSSPLFSKNSKAGQIFYVKDGLVLQKNEVMEKWKKTLFLKNVRQNEAKGWLLDIMNCIDALNRREFSLNDLYQFERELAEKHANNKNIKPKIRQQLQFLRERGYLDFVGAGSYRLK